MPPKGTLTWSSAPTAAQPVQPTTSPIPPKGSLNWTNSPTYSSADIFDVPQDSRTKSQLLQEIFDYTPSRKRQEEIASRYVEGKSSLPEMVTQSAANTVGGILTPVVKTLGKAAQGVDYVLSGKGKYNPLPENNGYNALKSGVSNTYDKTVGAISDALSIQKYAQSDNAKSFDEYLRGANDLLAITPLPKVASGINKTMTAAEEYAAQQLNKLKESSADTSLQKVVGQIQQAEKVGAGAKTPYTAKDALVLEKIAQSNVLPQTVDKTGTIDATKIKQAQQQYLEQPIGVQEDGSPITVRNAESVVGKLLEQEGATVNINEITNALKSAVENSNLPADTMQKAIEKGVPQFAQALMKYADEFGNIALDKLHTEKIRTTTGLDYSKPLNKIYRKSLASGLRQIIENKSKQPIAAINQELALHLEAVKRIGKLAGKKVEGGRLGTHVARGVGTGLGIVLGKMAGPIGATVGGAVGGELGAMAQSAKMQRTFGKTGESTMPGSPLLEQASIQATKPRVKNLRVADNAVGAAKGIPKNKEILRLEKSIKENVAAQKEAIRAKDFELVAKLKEVYDMLVEKLKDAIRKVKEIPNRKGGFANFGAKVGGPTPESIAKNLTNADRDALQALSDAILTEGKSPSGEVFSRVTAIFRNEGVPDKIIASDIKMATLASDILDADRAMQKNLVSKTTSSAQPKSGHISSSKATPTPIRGQGGRFNGSTPAEKPLLEQAKNFKTAEEFVKAQQPTKVKFSSSKSGKDYMGGHEAPMAEDINNPIWDLTGEHTGNDLYPKDIYSSDASRMYSSGMDYDSEAISILHSLRNRPNAPLTVYRAVPKNAPAEINAGDWVAITRSYAKDHGESNLGNNYKIVKKEVKARDIFTDANSIQEFGYDPQPRMKGSEMTYGLLQKATSGGKPTVYDVYISQLTDIWKQAHGGTIPSDASHLAKAKQALRDSKGYSASDIQEKHPDINLKRDVPITDIRGNKAVIPAGEALTPYELKGNKVLLQDGETYIVSKNQYANIKGQAISGEAKPFAPELKGTEETVKGTAKMALRDKAYADFDAGKITREQRNAIIDKLGVPNETKYSSYTLPGGKNYKEVLIKAPVEKELTHYRVQNGKDVPVYATHPDKPTFKSSHWDEPNVLAHLRLNERTYNGKPVTFMEELQSDLAREGRSKGFMRDMTPEEAAQVKKNYEYTGGGTPPTTTGSIPNLFKQVGWKEWVEPTVKRALQEAVANKSEYFAWINGEQTSARYNLATHVQDVNWAPVKRDYGGEFKNLTINPKEGSTKIHLRVEDDGTISYATHGDWVNKKLDEVLGKGLADSIMSKDKGTLSGEGLKFGGEWANTLYDKQVKNIVEDVTGGKVENLDMGLPVDGKPRTDWHLGYNQERGGGVRLTPKDLKVGEEVINDSEKYIITDILGDGKFKAVPKDAVVSVTSVAASGNPSKYVKFGDNYANKEAVRTFDISTKTTTQQGIRLTPEIIAKIKGEAPVLKKPSGKSPL